MSARSYQLLLSTPTKANIELMRQAMVAGVEIQQTGADYKTAVERPGGQYWDGAAADAARETASSDEKVFLGAGQAILNGAPNVIDSLSRALEQQNACISLHDQATGDHYKIADDLTVEWDAPPGASKEQVAKGKEYAANIQARLQRMYDAWGAADLEAASQTDAMDLDTLLAPAGGLDAARGNEDGSALQGGYVDPELIKRVRAASVLSPEQVDALAAGKPVTIPSNQMQYLYQLSRSLDGKTPGEVNAFLNGIQNPQDRTAVKDALAMVSNKNIRSGIDNKAGVTEATRGNFIPTAGSVANLPDGVREALTRADRVGVSFDNAARGYGGPQTELRGVADMQDVANIFQGVTPGYLNGSEAAQAMLGAASDYSNAEINTHNDNLKDFTSGITSDARGDFKSAVADMFQAGSADHVDIAEMAREPESASPGADSFLRALNEQHWGDQGAKVDDVLQWAADDPNNPLAQQVANEQAHYLADPEHQEALRDLPGPGQHFTGDSWAEANPELAKTTARLEGSHVAELFGADNANTPEIRALPDADQAKNLMANLDRNEDAAKIINGGAYNEYAHNLSHAAQMPEGAERDNAFEDGGRIKRGMLDGAMDALNTKDADPATKKLGEWVTGQLGVDKAFAPIEGLEAADQAIQGNSNPADAANKMVTTGPYGFNTLDSQKAILNGLLQSNPDLANYPDLDRYLTNGHPDPLKIAQDANGARTLIGNVLRENGFAPDQWQTQEQQGADPTNRKWRPTG
ncbi:TPR repeat region-containing protein [Mycobacteroides abscessus]|uniref:TPR repeat region-containing protein n=1 Tax=Mycobacteroides abscessus TaxID=36809 RepID=UPI0009A6BAAE|nr:hypothetical protein [Mycobacteroides abscessus]SKT30106.1 Uncharacterised protein [Mycobacteroides abscessus subsp. bolletii]